MKNILEKTLTLRIKLIFELKKNLWPVLLDKARLEDAVLNMCINSMHAMPEGGSLTVASSNIHLSDVDAHALDVIPGDYVMLSISDIGIGMTEEVKDKMFDPFFTTKGTKGTGLGMSQVYGFVQQSGGTILVYSEPGHGTRIILYIPRLLDTVIDKFEERNIDAVESPLGSETILVVDDEVALLDLEEVILTNQGYKVFRAESGEQALKILESESIDLLLSDVIMPGMDGYQLASEVEKRYPMIKIQIVSGFTDDRKKNQTNYDLHEHRLHKPVRSEKLLRRIRDLLDDRA